MRPLAFFRALFAFVFAMSALRTAARADPISCPTYWDTTQAASLYNAAVSTPGLPIPSLSPYSIAAAGGETILAIDRPYETAKVNGVDVTGAKSLALKVLFVRETKGLPTPSDVRAGYAPLIPERLPGDDAFAKSQSLGEGWTRIPIAVPDAMGGGAPFFWSKGRIAIVGCENDKVVFVSALETSFSSERTAFVATVLLTAFIYVFAAVRVSMYENKFRVKGRKVSRIRCLDPVVLCSGPDSKGSMSRLQVLFFSVLVFASLFFVFIRVGLLSDMSPSVLLLLGISAAGAAGSHIADNQQERLSAENWSWLITKRWLPQDGLASVNIAKWGDLITGLDGFDIYHFQMLIFSLVVGFGLLRAGYGGLQTFAVPDSLLELLGLSNGVYIVGKVANPPSFKELDAMLTDLRKLEDPFLAKIDGAIDFATALAVAGPEYKAYATKRGNVLPMLYSLFPNYKPQKALFDDGVKDPKETLEPGYPYPADLPKPQTGQV